MSYSNRNQALEAEYAAKLETHAALLLELAEIEEATNNIKQQIVVQSAQHKHFKNKIIPEGEKLLNDTRAAHAAWLTGAERNDQHRTRLTELLYTKMSDMEEEAQQLNDNIAEQEIQDEQLHAIIAELMESIAAMQPISLEIQAEIDKSNGLQLIVEKRKAELEKIEKCKKELLKTAKANCIQGNDEIQLLKERYAEVKVEETTSADELKRLRQQKADLDAEQIRPRLILESYRKRLDEVEAEAEVHRVNSKPELELIEAEKANVLAEQEAQHLAHDEAIAELTRELRKVKMEVANLERQKTVLRMHSDDQLASQEQAEFSITMRSRVHSTPFSRISSTCSNSPNLSPIFNEFQAPQQTPNNHEIQKRFDNGNINERTALGKLPLHSRSNAQNQ